MLAATEPQPKQAPKPHNWRGVAEGLAAAERQLAAGNTALAEQTLHEVLEFAPREARAWHRLGKVLQQEHRHAEALECFAKAEKLYVKPLPTAETMPASLSLAKMLRARGEHEEAMDMLGRLLTNRPEDPGILALKAEWENPS